MVDFPAMFDYRRVIAIVIGCVSPMVRFTAHSWVILQTHFTYFSAKTIAHQENTHDLPREFQDPKMEVPTIYKAYFSGLNFREYPPQIWPNIWYVYVSPSVGSWNGQHT